MNSLVIAILIATFCVLIAAAAGAYLAYSLCRSLKPELWPPEPTPPAASSPLPTDTTDAPSPSSAETLLAEWLYGNKAA